MLIIDAKTSFLDDDGNPLSGGRLRYFAFGTTTPITVYADSDYIVALGSVVSLTHAGWTSTGIYAQQSVTVHVDRYIGMDEYGIEQYEEVKVYDYLTSSSGGGVSETTVDTIDDLKNVTPVDGLAVTVKSYFALGDCPVRTYRYDVDSTAIENLGTVIESSVTVEGRWLLDIEGPYVDSRIFGVVAGSSPMTSNAAFAYLLQYCQSVGKTAYFIGDSFYLTSGGSLSTNAAIKADAGCLINSNSGTYTLTVTNCDFDIATTFAGTGLELKLNSTYNQNWQSTIVPLTAFRSDSNYADLTGGNAAFSVRVDSSLLTKNVVLSKAYTFHDWYINNGTVINIGVNGVSVKANTIVGTGWMNLISTSYTAIEFDHVKSSNIYNNGASWSAFLSACRNIFYLDSAISITTGTSTEALIIAENAGTVDFSGTVHFLGGFEGKQNFIQSDSGAVDVGYRNLDGDFFANANCLINSFNVSTGVPFLDMKGASGSSLVTRAGKIINGEVGQIDAGTGNVVLERVTITTGDSSFPCVVAGYLDATNCTFNWNAGTGTIINVSASKLTQCVLNGNSGTSTINGANAIWNEVTFSGNINMTCIGGSGRLTNVSGIKTATLIPDATAKFGNWAWIGGSATTINFDASQMEYAGIAIAYNVSIQKLLDLTGNINVINGSSIKAWGVNGHYNVPIGDNEGVNTRRTYGVCRANVGLWSGDTGVINSMPLLLFNRAASTGITSGRLLTCYSLESNNWSAVAYVYPGETDVLQSNFAGAPAFRVRKLYGSPVVGDDCYINFEVYK